MTLTILEDVRFTAYCVDSVVSGIITVPLSALHKKEKKENKQIRPYILKN